MPPTHLLDVDREHGLLFLLVLAPAAAAAGRAVHGTPGHVAPAPLRLRAEAATATFCSPRSGAAGHEYISVFKLSSK